MNKANSSPAPLVLRFIFVITILFVVFLHIYLLMPGVDAGIHMYGSLLLSKGHLPYAELWNNKPPLIYYIGAIGFLSKSDPFLNVRIIELFVFCFNLYITWKITKAVNIYHPVIYLLTFSVLYLTCWEGGFLTETFTIPLTLAATYLLIRRTRNYEIIGALLLVLCFLLKQNAAVVIAGILAVDIISDYRLTDRKKKLKKYGIAFLIYLLIAFLVLYRKGLWGDFVDQVFVYNIKYGEQFSLYDGLRNHFFHNSFLSVKGISAIMIFNLCMFFTLWKYWKLKKAGYVFELKELLLLNAILIYLAAYWFVYISGKTYGHYFMLLIVPATFILARYVKSTIAGKIALLILIGTVYMLNIPPVTQEEGISVNRKQVADYIRNNSSAADRIHVAGFGNQYLYVMADRLSPTKFIMPLLENNGYTPAYKKILTGDLAEHPPLFIIVNKKNYKDLDPENFYTQTIDKVLKKYGEVLENDQYLVYKRK